MTTSVWSASARSSGTSNGSRDPSAQEASTGSGEPNATSLERSEGPILHNRTLERCHSCGCARENRSAQSLTEERRGRSGRRPVGRSAHLSVVLVWSGNSGTKLRVAARFVQWPLHPEPPTLGGRHFVQRPKAPVSRRGSVSGWATSDSVRHGTLELQNGWRILRSVHRDLCPKQQAVERIAALAHRGHSDRRVGADRAMVLAEPAADAAVCIDVRPG